MSKISITEAWQGHADCEQCSLRHSVLFANLNEQDFKRLHEPIHQYAYPPGSSLYIEGEAGSTLYTIRKGLVKLVQYLPDGNFRIVRLVQASDVIGLETLLDQPYQHDAIALHETEVCQISTDAVNQLARENPSLHRELLKRWQQALGDADAWLTQLSTGTARQRVARLLQRLARKQNNQSFQLFSREDMGAMLGITTETASRVIAEFKRQSLLMEHDTGSFLCDMENLQRISDD